jgi:squalene cyclase
MEILARASDEYLTAYVAVCLAATGDAEAHEAVHQAWQLLLGRRDPQDGWGWSADRPTDADSTAWGLRLAEQAGAAGSPRAQAARQVLAQHQLPGGGVACYRPGLFIQRPFDGWCQPHACVTAGAAVLSDFRDGALEYLRQAQLPDGGWKAYWWCQPEFAAALAAEAFVRAGNPYPQTLDRARRWAKGRLNARGAAASPERPGGSPFATAACLQTMLLASETLEPESAPSLALAWLLRSQRADGSWSPSAQVRAPSHEVEDPDLNPQGNVTAFDLNRTFTTATVLAALVLARAGGS